MKLIQDTNIPKLDNLIEMDGTPATESDVDHFKRQLKLGSDTYVELAGENEVGNPANWAISQVWFGFDYLWLLVRLDEWMASQTWASLSNDNKDYMIYYNRHRGPAGDGDKVGHMIASSYNSTIAGIDYSTITTPNLAIAQLERIHSENIDRTKPSCDYRGNHPSLVNTIISYHAPEYVDTILNTIRMDLNDYILYSRFGTSVPGETSGLKDYWQSTGDYAGAGYIEDNFPIKSSAPAPGTLEGCRDNVVDILFYEGIPVEGVVIHT
jgi:hypothetical protein